jgi:hypothetical protein
MHARGVRDVVAGSSCRRCGENSLGSHFRPAPAAPANRESHLPRFLSASSSSSTHLAASDSHSSTARSRSVESHRITAASSPHSSATLQATADRGSLAAESTIIRPRFRSRSALSRNQKPVAFSSARSRFSAFFGPRTLVTSVFYYYYVVSAPRTTKHPA